jgi:DNA-directed RNA polymerase subunit F
MIADASLVWALERNLQRACSIHTRYLELLKKERTSLKKFSAAEVEALREKREEFLRSLEEVNAARIEILSKLPGGNSEKLTDLLAKEFSPSDRARLQPIVDELKTVAIAVQHESREFSQVVNFALNLVHGSLSILWSASQDVTRSYNAGGALQETHTPSGSRMQGVRREA